MLMFLIHTATLYNKSMNKLVGINSLRFFAIAFIVTYHLFRDFLPGGFIAVEVFFCVSGFLVTSKLCKQINKDGKLSWRHFVFSRLRRLYPALIVCIVLSLTLGIFANPDVLTGARRNTLTALTFSTNISELAAGGSYENSYLPNIFEHTWFLALMMQFYLILPLLFKLFLKICAKPRDAIRATGVALIVLAVSSAVLMACYGGFFGMPDRAYFALDSHMLALCLGGAYAVYKFFVPRSPRTTNRLAYVGLLVSVPIMTCFAVQLRFDNPFTFIVGLPAIAALTVVVLACIIKLQHNIRERRKTMNIVRVFEAVGNLSYGIYLFHWPLYILLPHLLPYDTAPWGYAIINILLSLVLSSIVYRLFGATKVLHNLRKRRRSVRFSYASVALVFVAASVVTIVRAPKTSSIADQLSDVISQDSNSLIEAKSSASDYIDATQILDETVAVFDAQLRLAQDAELLPAPTTSLAAANANSANVLVIGDSVTLGAKQSIESTIAKSFVDAKENRGIETARGILANYSATGKLPSIIVISLATNQRTITDQTIQEIVDIAGKGHRFILVTAYAGPLQPRDSQNAALKSYANSHDNVYIADWWEVAHDNWSLMYADHIHLNPAGRTAYANLLSNAIKGIR